MSEREAFDAWFAGFEDVSADFAWAAWQARAALAQAAAAQPAHVGESRFEGWFAAYDPAGKGDKQRARDAYAAGMSDAEAAQPVAWCSLTPSGHIEYFDGKPMVMFGPVGNEMHQTPLFVGAAPQPAEAAPKQEAAK